MRGLIAVTIDRFNHTQKQQNLHKLRQFPFVFILQILSTSQVVLKWCITYFIYLFILALLKIHGL